MDSFVPLRAPPLPLDSDQFHLLARALDALGSAIFVTDRENHIVWLNQALVRLSGYTVSEVLGATPAMLDAERMLHPAFDSMRQRALGCGDIWRGERLKRHKDGSIYVTDEMVSALTNANGDITHFITLLHDVTQTADTLLKAQHRANHDALTGLACRAYFSALEQRAIDAAALSRGMVAVLFLDLDGFKAINDTYGHHTGDLVLKAVADRLQGVVRGSDTVARFGGDEFVVLLPALAHRRAPIRLARKMLALVAEPFAIAQSRHVLSASVGIALYPAHGVTGAALLDQADRAMYCAKRAGGNRYCLVDGALAQGAMLAAPSTSGVQRKLHTAAPAAGSAGPARLSHRARSPQADPSAHF